jgi:hypothetical protein
MNILVDQHGHVFLSGFSLADFVSAEDDDPEFDAWTSNAAADRPDVDTGIAETQGLVIRTPASDVYAFACMFVEVRYFYQLPIPTLTAPSFVRSTLARALL